MSWKLASTTWRQNCVIFCSVILKRTKLVKPKAHQSKHSYHLKTILHLTAQNYQNSSVLERAKGIYILGDTVYITNYIERLLTYLLYVECTRWLSFVERRSPLIHTMRRRHRDAWANGLPLQHDSPEELHLSSIDSVHTSRRLGRHSVNSSTMVVYRECK